MSKLFTPTDIGAVHLGHRVVMAPLTRMRSDPGHIPNALMATYYEQRASKGGLIVSEATPVSLQGFGYAGAPGIYADSQIAGWRRITDAVHAKGGRIFLQLWHVGRQSHVSLQPGGAAPVAPSAIRAEGDALLTDGPTPYSTPRALRLDEIPAIIEDYRQGAIRAVAAGFDGVEVHGANGYLPDQFLQDGTNKRDDAYGGPVENRARFLLEVVETAVSVWGRDRVGVRISPAGTHGSMVDSNPAVTFSYVAEQLDRYGLAYLHVIEPRRPDSLVAGQGNEAVAAKLLRPFFKGPIIVAGGFTGETAEAILASGDADLVTFGRDFIANPDLPDRLRFGQPLNNYDRSTFYYGGSRGYVDYPRFSELAA